MLSVNISDIAIITVKNVYYRCIIHKISKYEGINLLKNFWFFQGFFLLFCLVYIKWLILWTYDKY